MESSINSTPSFWEDINEFTSRVSFNRTSFERYISYFTEKIESTEKTIQTGGSSLGEYSKIENELRNFIQSNDMSPLDRKFYKKCLRETLYMKFIETDTDNRRKLEKKIIDMFYEFLSTVDDRADLKKYFNTEFSYSNIHTEQNDNTGLNKILKQMEKGIFDNCLTYLLSNLPEIEDIPQFLMHNEKQLIKEKVNRIWKINYQIPVSNLKMQSEIGYQFLSEKFLDFVNEKVNLFDERFFDNETLVLLFDVLLLSNLEYIQTEENLKTFLNNAHKYIFLMGLSEMNNVLVNKIDEGFNKFKEERDTSLLMIEISDVMEKLKGKLCNEFLIIEKEVNFDSFLFLVFSFSIMLNNLAKPYVEYDQNGKISLSKSVFSSQLKCSSRERQFLKNALKIFDDFLLENPYNISNSIIQNPDDKLKAISSFHLNYMLENSIFSNLIKSYTNVLFDEQNKTKIILSFDRILTLLQKVNPSYAKLNNQNEEISGEEYLINTLNEFDGHVFTNLFNQFYSTYIEESDCTTNNYHHSKEKKSSLEKVTMGIKIFYLKLRKKKLRMKEQNVDEEKDKEVQLEKFDPGRLMLIPHDPINISTHICLCVNGMFTQDDYRQGIIQDHMWNNLTIENKNLDYYFYKWQDKENFYMSNKLVDLLRFIKSAFSSEYTKEYDESQIKNIKSNKNTSKYFGKFLAYILASRAVFKFHSISLIGYSLGCNVIKHCLMELSLISNTLEVSDIIHDIVFIGGATVLDNKKINFGQLFKNVAGRIVNCYSVYDKKLPIFSERAIGLGELKNEEDGGPVIENFDLSYLKLDHDDYKVELDRILNKIRIL